MDIHSARLRYADSGSTSQLRKFSHVFFSMFSYVFSFQESVEFQKKTWPNGSRRLHQRPVTASDLMSLEVIVFFCFPQWKHRLLKREKFLKTWEAFRSLAPPVKGDRQHFALAKSQKRRENIGKLISCVRPETPRSCKLRWKSAGATGRRFSAEAWRAARSCDLKFLCFTDFQDRWDKMRLNELISSLVECKKVSGTGSFKDSAFTSDTL